MENMGSKSEERNVLITGFGPFVGHPINASWEVVKELSKRSFAMAVKIWAEQIPVLYSYIKEKVAKLEKEYQPKLIIHVGVSGLSKCVQIEECAHSSGYERIDIEGCTPDESCIIPECLSTSLDVTELRMFCDKHSCPCDIEPSHDAGRYLCEYIYYTSLKANTAPVLFVHVPCLDTPYSKEELADALNLIILAALSQIYR